MVKPFQFWIRRICAATALFCLAAWLLSIGFRPFKDLRVVFSPGEMINGRDMVERYFAIAGAIVCGIAGIGAITETKIAKLVQALAILATALLFLGLITWFALAKQGNMGRLGLSLLKNGRCRPPAMVFHDNQDE